MKKQETDIYEKLIGNFKALIESEKLWNEEVIITGRTLTNQEAIGTPDRTDFPLLTGKEALMEDRFKESRGQAFTECPGPFRGTLKDIIDSALESNHKRAVFVASLNAVTSYLKKTEGTVHCRDNEPEICAEKLSEFIREKHGNPKIALVGYQPSMLENLSRGFDVRVLDLDREKIGSIRYGVTVESGQCRAAAD